jgi:hypothetical protein
LGLNPQLPAGEAALYNLSHALTPLRIQKAKIGLRKKLQDAIDKYASKWKDLGVRLSLIDGEDRKNNQF